MLLLIAVTGKEPYKVEPERIKTRTHGNSPKYEFLFQDRATAIKKHLLTRILTSCKQVFSYRFLSYQTGTSAP